MVQPPASPPRAPARSDADCRFDEAVACLESCSPACFQPAQLFPLFPAYTEAWLAEAPPPRAYWDLHPPLASLEALVERRTSHEQAGPSGRAESGGSAQGRRPYANGVHGEAAGAPAAAAAAGAPATNSSSNSSGNSVRERKAAVELKRQRLEREARQSLVHYLFRVRRVLL